MNRFLSKPSTFSGFSFVEVLVAVVIIGILATLAIPSWQKLVINQRANRAQEQAYQALQRAKFNAKREKRDWLVSFRENNGEIEYAIHRLNGTLFWQELISEADTIAIDPQNTTLSTSQSTCNNFYCARFTHRGTVGGRLGRITFVPKNNQDPKKCVFISTRLGTLRRDEDEGC